MERGIRSTLLQQCLACLSIFLLLGVLSSCGKGRIEPTPTEVSATPTPTAIALAVPTPTPIPPLAASQDATVVRIVPASQQLAVGQTAVVQLQVDHVTELWGAEIELGFDPALLRVRDADPAEGGVQIQGGGFPLPDFVAKNEANNALGTVNYVLVQLPPNQPVNGSGLLASITLEGVNEGNSSLAFSTVKLATIHGQPILASSQAGTITVVGATPSPTVTPIPSRPPISGDRYVVQSGDTLYSISRRCGVSVQRLATYNQIPDPGRIYVGQVLHIPRPGAPLDGYYVVRRGDTLYSISRRSGVSVWQLAAYNNIYNPNLIYVGQTLVIPRARETPTGYYRVRQGDTFYSISRHFGLSVQDLASYNGILNPDRLYVGQLIRIPPR